MLDQAELGTLSWGDLARMDTEASGTTPDAASNYQALFYATYDEVSLLLCFRAYGCARACVCV